MRLTLVLEARDEYLPPSGPQQATRSQQKGQFYIMKQAQLEKLLNLTFLPIVTMSNPRLFCL